MKTIEFGYDNSNNPTGSFEGISLETEPGKYIYKGNYFGAINYNGDDYIVAKVIEADSNHPELNNRFVVRSAIADLFSDGSGTIYLDQEQSFNGKTLEEELNRKREQLENITDICRVLNTNYGKRSFDALTFDKDNILVTAIRHDIFTRRKEALNNCTKSIVEMSLEQEILYKKNDSLEAMLNDNNTLESNPYYRR